eukprot:4629437-Prymnesium_polylepis.1
MDVARARPAALARVATELVWQPVEGCRALAPLPLTRGPRDRHPLDQRHCLHPRGLRPRLRRC